MILFVIVVRCFSEQVLTHNVRITVCKAMLTLGERLFFGFVTNPEHFAPGLFAIYAQMPESEIKSSLSGRLSGDATCGILLCRNESSDVRKRL